MADRKKRMSTNKERELLTKFQGWIEGGLEGREEWRNQAELAYSFLEGGVNQWRGKDLEVLKKEKRPANTWNIILPKINVLSGIMSGQNMDIKAFPRGIDDEAIARIMSEQLKYVQDINNSFSHEMKLFDDSTIQGLGWEEIHHDFEFSDDVLFGDITASRVDPFLIVADQNHVRFDAQDSRFIAKMIWMNIDDAKRKWPRFSNTFKPGAPGGLSGADIPANLMPHLFDQKKNNIRIIDLWYKVPVSVFLLMNLDTAQVLPFDSRKSAEDALEQLNTQAGEDLTSIHRIVKRESKKVRHAILSGLWKLLEDNPSPYDHRLYPFIPYRGFQFLYNSFGITKNLFDPQQEINKRMSQALHSLNTTANSGWEIPKGSVEDPDKFKRESSSSGFQYEYDAQRGKPSKIIPTPLSQGHVELGNTARIMADIISGIQPELAGQTSGVATSGVPGKAVVARQSGSLLSVNRFLQNFWISKKLKGQMLTKMIQQFHPPEKIMRIIGDRRLAGEQDLPDQPSIAEKIENFDALPFDIVISLQPPTETARQAQFLQVMTMIQAGIPVPPEILVDLSNVPGKDQILKALEEKGLQPQNGDAENAINQIQGQQGSAI